MFKQHKKQDILKPKSLFCPPSHFLVRSPIKKNIQIEFKYGVKKTISKHILTKERYLLYVFDFFY